MIHVKYTVLVHPGWEDCYLDRADFLDALQVGEQSGRLDEAMLHLADDYQDRARVALVTLTTIAGFMIWGLVALMIIAILVNMVSGYANFIEDLANPHR